MPISISTFPTLATKTYQSIRPDLRSGDILLCSGTSFISTLIQKATHSVWSHVAFILKLEAINRIMVLESVESIGIRTVPLSSYIENYNGSGTGYPGKVLIARHQEFNSSLIKNLSQNAVDLLGYPYDTQEILRIAGRISSKFLGFTPPTANVIGQDNAYICSEYAYVCYESVGINIQYDQNGYVTPADFAKTQEINGLNFIQIDNTTLNTSQENAMDVSKV